MGAIAVIIVGIRASISFKTGASRYMPGLGWILSSLSAILRESIICVPSLNVIAGDVYGMPSALGVKPLVRVSTKVRKH